MRIVSTRQSITVPVEHGRQTITLTRGVSYIMHDVEVISGQQAGVFTSVQALPETPGAFDCEQTNVQRIIVPFIGGLGDAVSMLPILETITEQTGAMVDVATTPGPREVFELSPCVHAVRPYPMQASLWRTYDAYLSMECVTEQGHQPGQALPDVFAHALGLRRTSMQFRLHGAPDARCIPHRPAGPYVGVAVGEQNTTRIYPAPAMGELISRLAAAGRTPVLLGLPGDNHLHGIDQVCVIDMRGRTPRVRDLAAVLTQLDAVVAHDSFIMHLAGALGCPGIGLFAPTSEHHARPYVSLSVMAGRASCAPCHDASGRCPQGHASCIAWDDDAIAPACIVQRINDVLASTKNRAA